MHEVDSSRQGLDRWRRYAAEYLLRRYNIERTDIYFTVKNVFGRDDVVDLARSILPGAPRLFRSGSSRIFECCSRDSRSRQDGGDFL
jgi:hypothetical protein